MTQEIKDRLEQAADERFAPTTQTRMDMNFGFRKGVQEAIEFPEKYGLFSKQHCDNLTKIADLSLKRMYEAEAKYHALDLKRTKELTEMESEIKSLMPLYDAAKNEMDGLQSQLTKYRGALERALQSLQARRPHTPGLGAPINIIKSVLEQEVNND